jgi:hypothetical protein
MDLLNQEKWGMYPLDVMLGFSMMGGAFFWESVTTRDDQEGIEWTWN